MQDKACAIVTSNRVGVLHVLLFRHPTAGVQIVKGTVENGETPAAAVTRELHEESGLVALSAQRLIVFDHDTLGECWHVFQRIVEDTPDTWSHETRDDHGHRFAFFWQPLSRPTPPDMDDRFVRVLAAVRTKISGETRA